MVQAENPPREPHWYPGDPVPEPPSSPTCTTVEEYYWPTEACATENYTWKDYCWWMNFEEDENPCSAVRDEVWLDPSLEDPDIPAEECFVAIEEQTEDCVEQWLTFEEQCRYSWDHKKTDECDEGVDEYIYGIVKEECDCECDCEEEEEATERSKQWRD